jgi:hypothetical protein
MAKMGGGCGKVLGGESLGIASPGVKTVMPFPEVEKEGEGLRGRKLSQKCRSRGPAVDAKARVHAFAAIFAGGKALTEP